MLLIYVFSFFLVSVNWFNVNPFSCLFEKFLVIACFSFGLSVFLGSSMLKVSRGSLRHISPGWYGSGATEHGNEISRHKNGVSSMCVLRVSTVWIQCMWVVTAVVNVFIWGKKGTQRAKRLEMKAQAIRDTTGTHQLEWTHASLSLPSPHAKQWLVRTILLRG